MKIKYKRKVLFFSILIVLLLSFLCFLNRKIYIHTIKDMDLAIYVDNERQNTIPKGNYGLDTTHSTCKNGTTLTANMYNRTTGKMEFVFNKPDACKLYFGIFTLNYFVQNSAGSSNYTNQNNLPTGGSYSINTSKSSCNAGTTINKDMYSNGTLNISPKASETCNIYFDISSVRVESGDGTNVGDQICIGSGTSDCFYVVENNGTNVQMLAKYNLNSSSKQVSSGTVTLAFDSSVYWSSSYTRDDNYYYVFDSNSTTYTYVNNYVTYLNNTYNIGVTGKLLSYSQATSKLSCTYSSWGTKSCASSPSWVRSTSYWLGTAQSSSQNRIFYITSSAFNYATGTTTGTYGVRPLIVMSADKIPSS